jgi:hypothetical protein
MVLQWEKNQFENEGGISNDFIFNSKVISK